MLLLEGDNGTLGFAAKVRVRIVLGKGITQLQQQLLHRLDIYVWHTLVTVLRESPSALLIKRFRDNICLTENGNLFFCSQKM